MPRVGTSPFIFLILFVVFVYAVLAIHNWTTWQSEYFKDEVYRYRPLVYHSKVKIQEDKRKIFPLRHDVFAPQSSAIPLNPIQQSNSSIDIRPCAQFNAFIYPLTKEPSQLAQHLHSQLSRLNYATIDPQHACVFVAVLDEPKHLSQCTYIKEHADKHIIYLLNDTLNKSIAIQHVFSNNVFDINGIHLNVTETQNPKKQNDLRSFKMADFVYIDFSQPSRFYHAFYSALSSGAIPVINRRHLSYLPLSDLIDWKVAVIQTTETQLPFLLDNLEGMNQLDVMETRRQGQFLFRHYLADYKGIDVLLSCHSIGTLVLARSTLSAVRYRMQIPAPMERSIQSSLLMSKMPKNYALKRSANLRTSFSALTVDWNVRTLIRNERHVFNRDPTFLDTFSPFDGLGKEKPLGHLGAFTAHWIENRRGVDYSSQLNGNMPDEEFTIVLLAYKRDQQLRHVLSNLNGLRFLRQILVVWSDVEREPPTSNFWPEIHVPIHFIRAHEDSLNVRFLPFDLIDTEAVFSMDDDFEASNAMIEFMFRVWRENRDTLVGPNQRLGYVDPITQRGVYRFETECRYNMILTSGAFLHRNYLFAYWNTMPKEIREWVDKWKNCEDIAMNFLISDLSRKPPIKVTPIVGTVGKFIGNVGLSQRPEHLWNRAKCLEVFEEIYGYNSLLLSETRHDSVHYNHPSELQCFSGT
ncbi:Exostosin-2-like protein [Aphelenchoides besseyi]|nr:Exostosin-2-like protein [Aphelenchoides besseyi]